MQQEFFLNTAAGPTNVANGTVAALSEQEPLPKALATLELQFRKESTLASIIILFCFFGLSQFQVPTRLPDRKDAVVGPV
eukprot:4800782-Amphidinium_carterae.3